MFKKYRSRTNSHNNNNNNNTTNNHNNEFNNNNILRPSRSDQQQQNQQYKNEYINQEYKTPFSRFHRRFSQPNSSINSSSQPRNYNYQILHEGCSSNDNVNNTNESAIEDDDGDENLSPLNSDNNHTNADTQSIALSEAPTLTVDRSHRMDLQETYIDNFTEYLPYVVRRLRSMVERRRQQHQELLEQQQSEQEQNENNSEVVPAPPPFDPFEEYDFDEDDLSTIYNEENVPSEQHALEHIQILDRDISVYNYRRQLVIMNGMLKHNTYIFPSLDSYQLFKQLRSNIKKDRKNSIIMYDSKGNIKKALETNVNKLEFQQQQGEDIIDNRNHIIPIDYKIKGLGLPLFKINVPYMSTFRKNSPFIIFKKFKEIPAPPTLNEEDVEFETFNYCFVYSKYSSNYRRLIFEFLPNTSKVFKVILFQSNFKPFSDFNYKDTRFRILGTTIASGLVCQYNPHMRLLLVDDDEPSLCDNIVNKPPSTASNFLKFGKKTTITTTTDETKTKVRFNLSDVKFNFNDPSTFINPIPQNSFVNQEPSFFASNTSYGYIPNDLPPFGCFKDASIIESSNSSSLFPKKYNEAGRITLYQDLTNITKDLNSTLSIDQDTLVMSVIFSTMREINLRNASKSSGNSMNILQSNSNNMSGMRLGAFGLATTGLSAL
ncbi:hypothetical protein KGF54_003117 [Candida jiufengensis]|uniref:uncharacterized protein n=1 Tax=Candida jiufengensis TaxID=497108 RepID=UPI002225596D|nr:uncharacterized protein KGF54_003117 [Candida jiufengensis]KAI5952251.1 hypothetical protein KGF54_003117 [Candida jiufengensis]